MSESFSTGLQHWELAFATGKMESANGMMLLQSNLPNQIAIAINRNFISNAFKYYVQADFVSDIPTAAGYGLVFGADGDAGTCYIFEIEPRSSTVRLWRFGGGAWQSLGELSPVKLMPYPRRNTLGVLFDNGNMTLYVNGDSIVTYVDKEPLRLSGVGAYVSRPGFRLLVDNFFGFLEN